MRIDKIVVVCSPGEVEFIKEVAATMSIYIAIKNINEFGDKVSVSIPYRLFKILKENLSDFDVERIETTTFEG